MARSVGLGWLSGLPTTLRKRTWFSNCGLSRKGTSFVCLTGLMVLSGVGTAWGPPHDGVGDRMSA